MINDSDLAVMQAAAVANVPRHIVMAEARLRIAQLNGDVAALDEMIATDLLFTGPDGQLGTKTADLEAYASGLVRFLDHEPEELRARLIGSRVVVTALRARLGVEVGGRVVRGVYRYTRIWACEGDTDWQVVGGHVSSVPAS